MQTEMPDEVILVDNNSTDQTASVAKNYAFVRVVTEDQQGVLFAARRGFDEAKHDIIGRLDADSRISSTWVQQVKEYFSDNADVSAITGNCYFYDFPFRKSFRAIHHAIYYGAQKIVTGTEILWGSNMAIRREAWLGVKSQCLYRRDVHEDIDLSIHLHKNSLKINRLRSLIAEVSLRRGSLTPLGIVKYLIPWPMTYWHNDWHLKAFGISLLLFVVWLVVLPISLAVWLVSSAKNLF